MSPHTCPCYRQQRHADEQIQAHYLTLIERFLHEVWWVTSLLTGANVTQRHLDSQLIQEANRLFIAFIISSR